MMKLLEQILADKRNRRVLIKEFQEMVWDNDDIDKILSDLAYDLDFYEPKEDMRKEEPSYYGDERLEMEIKSVIQKLNERRGD